MNIEIANLLLNYRKNNNLSQEELASKIGVSRQAVSKWERGEASPDTDNLIALAEIYGVTLDELLKGKNYNSNQNTMNNFQNTENYNTEYANINEDSENNSDYSGNYEKIPQDKVSFKNGIHINSKNGDKVNISFKDGIDIHSHNNDNVKVGWNGVFVEENGENKVYTDNDGNIYVRDDIKHHKEKNPALKIWNKIPFYAVAIILFILWGTSGVMHGWALSWLSFLTIPLYYSLGNAIFKHKPSHFAYPVLTLIIYIISGFYSILGGWTLGWIIFLTIPIYYSICGLFEHKS